MIDEVGLRGGWFSGTVLRMVSNEVFVELQDLLTDDGQCPIIFFSFTSVQMLSARVGFFSGISSVASF